jgi:hypothetical protein
MTVLVSDSFNRADSTTLGIADTGQSWQSLGTGIFGISSNQAYQSTTGADSLVYIDTTQTDVKTSVVIAVNQGQPGVFFRIVDANNLFRALRVSGTLYLQKKTSGTITTISTKTLAYVTNEKLSVISKSDGTIEVYVNDVLQISATDNTYVTSTKQGFGVGSANVGTRWDTFQIEDLGGGTNTSITSVIASATASAIAPTVTTQKQVSVSSVVANVNANALAPSISTSSSVSANITGTVATSTANAISPTIQTSKNSTIQSVASSATATALSPQVGSFTNVSVNTVTANATASANNPSVSTTRNISLGAPVSNAVASALVPNVGLSQSATIAATIASLVVDAIAPNVGTSQGTRINSMVAGSTASAMSPTIQTDAIISAIVAGMQASGMVPSINGKMIIGTIHLKGSATLNVYLVGSQTLNVSLKGGI